MGANFKREIIFELISTAIFTVLIVAHVLQYVERSNAPLTPVKTSSISSTTSGTVTTLSNNIVAKHNNPSDCWIIIENKVYDVTNFLARHPGGGGLVTPYCGQDATQPFLTQGGRGSHSQEALRLLGLIYVGDLNGTTIQQPDKNAIQNTSIRGGEDNDD